MDIQWVLQKRIRSFCAALIIIIIILIQQIEREFILKRTSLSLHEGLFAQTRL